MTGPFIYSVDDVLVMLDALLERNTDGWWDEFFADRAKPCPFFVDVPDENLVEWLDQGLVRRGRALAEPDRRQANAELLLPLRAAWN